MCDRAEARRAELVESVIEFARSRLAQQEIEAVSSFIRLWLRDVPTQDLVGRDALDIYGAVVAHWRFGAKRTPGTPAVRVYNPAIQQHGWQSRHTIVEIVNDDMPFLVDSIGMELTRHGLGLHLIVHPIIRTERDAEGRLTSIVAEEGKPESFMHFEIDRMSSPERLRAIETDLLRALGDVRRAVRDWRAMLVKVETAIAECRPPASVVSADELGETIELLRWMAADSFILLGYTAFEAPTATAGGGTAAPLGILDHPSGETSAALTAEIKALALESSAPLIISKASSRSTIHRATWLDLVVVKRYDEQGSVLGEHLFLGLFTSAAYNRSPADIPLLRNKVASIIERSGLGRSGHAGKALAQILETYPRDELFQTDVDTLFRIAIGILHLQDRQRTRLFMRPDPFGRFVSCLVYVPRERYNTLIRERMQGVLETTLGGTESEFQAQVSESILARIHFTIRTPNGVPRDLDAEGLEQRLAVETQSWTDRLRDALIAEEGEEEGNRLAREFAGAFPFSYQEAWPGRSAVPDVMLLDALAKAPDSQLAMSLYRRLEDKETVLRFKLLRSDEPVRLSDAIPIIERMGVRVLGEEPHVLKAVSGRAFAIHDFLMEPLTREPIDPARVRSSFEATFGEVFAGAAENDGFNRLVLLAGLAPREVLILRAACKYLLQVGIPFSQAYIEDTLGRNAQIAAALSRLFNARFDPAATDRDRATAVIREEITGLLEHVRSLDEDRIIRSYLGLFDAMLRTNWYQRGADGLAKPYLSFKLESKKVPGIPFPRPLYEIFVYAPFMEGIHLRGGKVARGGLRWSDRREDFRTEILGLMKAQTVKNSVIVPVGAKGGFVVKRPPAGGDRQAFQEEGIRCYRTLLRGLLDLTDNRTTAGIVPPADVVRYDDDDPYLVVAADKGTATFSDIANRMAREYGFWLDDAFASGGSAGYDHKGMAITARGAWEAVKRHFRELDLDPHSLPFTCVGVGDMSGDVFGNGMLMSDRTKLVAAFDHRHIFLDPSPDPTVSFDERKRLFALPRSSWADYDTKLISHGGGVWSRDAKSIPLSPEMAAVLGVAPGARPPSEVAQAILRSPVDLLWNGGIGTFVKAQSEGHTDAQDRVNDGLRVDAEELRCRVVAEGGNLGFTQKGRIAYARNGGRINTDFIDNSAGVDCSDHEVNIKVLLSEILTAGDLTLKQRDELLASMTDEVGELVLRDNILQNLALSVSQAMAPRLLDAQASFMRKLERQGRLDRAIEQLPRGEEIELRRREGRGLTRPESSVIMAYAKMTLYDDLLKTDLPDRVYFAGDLAKYFPRPLRRRFPEQIGHHRLRREIVATTVANSMVNRGLDVFVSELGDTTGADLTDIALAFVVARDAHDLRRFWGSVETLTAPVAAELQIQLLVQAREALIDGTRWFIANVDRPITIRDAVGRYAPAIRSISAALETCLPTLRAKRFAAARAKLEQAGIDPELARNAAALPLLITASDATLAAYRTAPGQPDPVSAARVAFALDEALELDWLRERLSTANVHSRWERLALSGFEDQLGSVLRRLTQVALLRGIGGDEATVPQDVVGFLESEVRGTPRFREIAEEITAAEVCNVAMLAAAMRVLEGLAPPA